VKTFPSRSKEYCSPATKKKFRSKKAALFFAKVLEEPGMERDERLAFTEFKKRWDKKTW